MRSLDVLGEKLTERKSNLYIRLLICACAIFATLFMAVGAYASNTAAHEYENTIKLFGSGEPRSNITVLLIDKDAEVENIHNDDIRYINQLKSDENGQYNLLFNYKGNVSDLKLRVLENNKPVEQDVVCKSVSEIFTVSAKTIQNGDKLTVFVDELDEFGNISDNITYDIFVSFYDKNDSIIGVQMLQKDKISGKKSVEIDMPQNTAYRKVYAWTSTMIPLADAKKQNYKNPISDKADSDEITVALIGDSTTHQNSWLGSYKLVLEHYYLTRYPDKKINFVNKGINGAGAQTILSVFDEFVVSEGEKKPDIALVMLGMNYRTNLKNVDSYENAVEMINQSEQRFEEDMIELLEKLKENDITPILMSSTLYDSAAANGVEVDRLLKTFDNGKTIDANMQLQAQAEFLKKYSEENNILYIPMNEITTELTQSIRKNKKSDNMLIFTRDDGIHPKADTPGAYLLGTIVSYSLTGNGCVASVKIDATDGNFRAENADVSDVEINNNEIQYTYKPKSLPLAVTASYNEIESEFGIDITSEINNEIVTISGLNEGNYELYIDDVKLGDYSSAEFEKGVNIATNENNPLQKLSLEIYNILDEMNDVSQICNNYWYRRSLLRMNGVNPDDDAAVKLFYANAEDKYREYCDMRDKYSEYMVQINDEYNNAQQICKTDSCTVIIKPSGN